MSFRKLVEVQAVLIESQRRLFQERLGSPGVCDFFVCPDGAAGSMLRCWR